ncbi:MAG: glycoside hydrolase [Gemmatimonadetes bacterium]|nr:MAG: glycoside hydrolase [Gemmatimonadota bacterium]
MLYVSFLWHMHQPMYEDPRTGNYRLPWVRLHALKDYYNMVAILDEFPQIHQTFNLSSSLIEQIEGYLNGKTDPYLERVRRPVDRLSPAAKVHLLKEAFPAQQHTMILPYPRLHELWLKRGEEDLNEEALHHKIADFTEQEWRDLQVWSVLAWIDPMLREPLKRFYEQGRHFTEADKLDVLAAQDSILARILPKYAEVQARGQIELSISPYFHPILPLLIDTNSALEALPNTKLPRTRFAHREDAARQIEMAIALYRRLFHTTPHGLWPSEGSVSQSLIPLIANHQIQWIASDEEILRRSQVQLQFLYQPYRVRAGDQTVDIVFRDHTLSDLIAFVYPTWAPDRAADDFIQRLHAIHQLTPATGSPGLVSVILDGENCWEHYPNDGNDFLRELYRRLSDDPDLKTTTIRDYLAAFPPQQTITHLFAGSWLNHNFKMWIGHEEENAAWEAVSVTRKTLATYQAQHPACDPAILAAAWREIYIAEGSDWFWWYGDEHVDEHILLFDELFREHLKQVYRLLEKGIPTLLNLPIKKNGRPSPVRQPQRRIQPVIDGKETGFYEWRGAGFYTAVRGGTMYPASTQIHAIHYGYDAGHLFLRIDVEPRYWHHQAPVYLQVVHPTPRQWQLAPVPPPENEWQVVAGEDLFEASLRWDAFPVELPTPVGFYVIVGEIGRELERHPPQHPIFFTAYDD